LRPQDHRESSHLENQEGTELFKSSASFFLRSATILEKIEDGDLTRDSFE